MNSTQTEKTSTGKDYCDIRTSDRMMIQSILYDCGVAEIYYSNQCLVFGVPKDLETERALMVILPKLLIMTEDKTPYRLHFSRSYRESDGPRETRRPDPISKPGVGTWKYVVFELV